VLAVASVVSEWVARVERTVEGLGYELVDVEREGHGLLRVTIDVPQSPNGVTVDDCERVSHQLTHMFAVENVEYDRLEVSSPGLDRPLKKARDFRRFEGAEIQLQLRAALDGRKRWRGTVLAVTGDAGSERVQLAVTPEEEAKEPVRRVRPAAAGGMGGRAAKAKAPAEQRKIEFAVAEVDRARLVPVLDFRSKQ
jgi:ribosome maturation factor RimP